MGDFSRLCQQYIVVLIACYDVSEFPTVAFGGRQERQEEEISFSVLHHIFLLLFILSSQSSFSPDGHKKGLFSRDGK
jgi:hypothetical protein